MSFATTDAIPQSYEIVGTAATTVASTGNPLKGTNFITSAVNAAHQRLAEQASKLGGNGVIGIRYTYDPLNDILVTGTAVRIAH